MVLSGGKVRLQQGGLCSAASDGPGPHALTFSVCVCVWVKQLVAKAHTGVKGGDDKAAFHILSLCI